MMELIVLTIFMLCISACTDPTSSAHTATTVLHDDIMTDFSANDNVDVEQDYDTGNIDTFRCILEENPGLYGGDIYSWHKIISITPHPELSNLFLL